MKKTILILLTCTFLLAAREQKKVYTGLRLGGSVGMVFPVGDAYYDYFGKNSDPNLKWRDGGSFDFAPFVSLQLTDFFALHTEVFVTKFGYFGEMYKSGNITEHDLISRRAVLVPILAKHTRRQDKHSLQCYIGPHFTINFGEWIGRERHKEGRNVLLDRRYTPNDIVEHIKYPPVGLTLGINYGIIIPKAGTVFLDIRFAEDLGMIKTLNDGTWYPILFRSKLSFSLGYEFALRNIRKNSYK